MGRQKKSELDAILEQLKKSYATDIEDDLEDSLLESEESEEDAELASVLERIFSDDEPDNEVDEPIKTETAEEIYAEQQDEASVSIESESLEEEIAEKDIVNDSISEINASQEDEVLPEHNKTEEEKVDDIFKMMFGAGTTEEEPFEYEDEGSPISPEQEYNVEDEISKTEDTKEAEKATETEDISEENTFILVEEEYPEDVYIDELQAAYEEANREEEIVPEPVCTKILDPNEYILDELQQTLFDISLYKPERDLSPVINEIQDSSPAEIPDAVIVESKKEMTDKDLSLLMKFGYEGEITRSGENQHAHKVIFAKSRNYVPEKYKIAHGFTGTEFSSKEQIPAIQKKYKSERISLLIHAIIVSVIALITLISDILSPFSVTEDEIISTAYVISVLLVIALLFKKIYTGIWAVMKFDANEYSLPSILLIEYVILGLITNVVSTYNSKDFAGGTFIRIGGYVLISLALAAWSEYIDCVRESAVFAFITDDKSHYVAEKRAQGDDIYPENKRRHSGKHGNSGTRYIIKRSEFISGYHYKSIEGRTEKINTVFVIGILPAIAIVAGIISIILNKSIINGINNSALVLFMAIPIASTVSIAVTNFLSYNHYKKNNSACIGAHSAREISRTSSIVFEDIDAVEIVACTEINPNRGTDTPQKWMNIARRVFETLGGPLSDAIGNDADNQSNISHDVAINSISDNGIDLYFDSSMNILIGDRHYMLSHNIKVKTDVNLTGATKGSERTVIYMAFDRIPQIGFIVASRIKKSFADAVELLCRNDIKVEVRSYEPEINEYFFESNSADTPISVVKPSNYEHNEPTDVSDSRLIAENPQDLCRAVIYSKTVAEDQIKLRKARKIQAAIGFMIAIMLVILSCLPRSIQFIKLLQRYIPILFYLSTLLITIPSIVQLIKIIKRK